MPLVIKNYSSEIIPIPESLLAGRVKIINVCKIEETELKAFNDALLALEIALNNDHEVAPGLFVMMIVTDKDTVDLTLDGQEQLGLYTSIAIIPIHRWRAHSIPYLKMLAISLEELCHCFWSIRDESIVKDKVVSVIQLIHPEVKRDDLFTENNEIKL